MKNIAFLLSSILLIYSCNNETCSDGIKNQEEVGLDCGGSCAACDIYYPPTGNEGQNILYEDDSLFLSSGNYSFDAEVPEGSSLKIEIELISGAEWFYGAGPQNWEVSQYSNGQQTFEVLNPGMATLRINLSPSPDPSVPASGSYKLKYFENGTAVTKSKILSWN